MNYQSPHCAKDRCSICLDTREDPVCLPCRHVYCRACITKHTLSREITTLEEALRLEFDNLIPIICPDCRNTIFAKRNQRLEFPKAKKCSQCDNYISRIVRFPCCSFTQSDDICLSCLAGQDTGDIKCPACETGWNATHLITLTLCMFCRVFKDVREAICECQEPVKTRDVDGLIAALLSEYERELETRRPQEARTPHESSHVPTNTQSRGQISGHKRIFVASFVILGALILWFLCFHFFIGNANEPAEERRQGKLRICRSPEMWIADSRGSIRKSACETRWVPYQTSKPKPGAKDLERDQAGTPVTIKKRVPVYQKDW